MNPSALAHNLHIPPRELKRRNNNKRGTFFTRFLDVQGASRLKYLVQHNNIFVKEISKDNEFNILKNLN